MTADAGSPMDMATRERTDLADYLSTLTESQWQAPSLCAEWSVKDVVAHMISYEELGFTGLLTRFAKGRITRANDVGVREYGALSTDELTDFVRAHARPSGLTSGLGGMIGLVDGTIHHQDIRRALHHPRAIAAAHLEVIVPSIPTNPRLGAWRRIRGLSLVATDIEWRRGTGPEITGPAEALMMAMSGRADALRDLHGAGVEILASRQPSD